MIVTYTTSSFLRLLLKKCIGTVMIEWIQWNLPGPAFDRGYLNDRLKLTAPVNALTHKRLLRLFEAIFTPENRDGRFQEPQAVEAANALIDLTQEYFDVDLSIWKNTYTSDNHASRSHLLSCLDKILSLTEEQEVLPIAAIKELLDSYMEDVKSREKIPVSDYPKLLTAAPYHQTDCFVGRENITDFLVDQLVSGRSCYLQGIGGIGKTEIAKSALTKILSMPYSVSGFTHVMWINYTDGNFALSLVRALNLDKAIHNLDQAFRKAVSVINQYRSRLLLIIDNVENAEDDDLIGLDQYLGCRILMTSRCKGFSSLLEIPVDPLSFHKCMELFYAYYHGKKDNIILRKIIELADRHTVTVELLAKIADSEELMLHELYDSLIRCGFHISAEKVTSVHEKLRSEGRVIEQLTKLFRVYGCTSEEQLLLIQTSTIPNIHFNLNQAKQWFKLKNRTLLNHLEKRGWIKKEALFDNGHNRYRYFMHSVIASAVRAQFLNDLYSSCKSFIREITVEMKDSLSQNDSVKKELIQFSWSLNDIFQGQFQSEDDCEFLWTLAEIYKDIGYYERALPLLDSLFMLYTNIYGEDCVHLGSVWNSRGMIEYELSHFNAAIEAYQNSHIILEKHLDSHDISQLKKVELAKLDLNIGKTYLKTDYTKAEPFFNHAYETFLHELGKDDQLTQNALGHKAMLLAHIGKLQEAEKIFLDIYNQIDTNTADREMIFLRAGIAHHLGSMYSDTAPTKAMPFLIEARDIFWNNLSPTHPDTLDVLNSIYSLQLSTEDDYSQILSDFQQLLDLFIKAYGPDNPNTGTIYNNIGLCHYYMNQPNEAIQNYREAIRIDRLSYGENHESTAYIYNNIGAVYSETGHPEKAIPEHKRALRIYEAAYPDHLNLDLALTHAELADAHLRAGDFDKVMEHLNEAFSIYGQMLPETAPQLLFPYTTLSNVLASLGDYENAITNYSHVIWLLLKNGYSEDSDSVQEFTARVAEIKQIQDSIVN